MSSEIQSVVASPATEEDDLLSRSTKKCKRRSSGDFFGCHDMSQVKYIEPVEGITNAPQSQQVGVTYLERIPFFKENPPIARMMKKKGPWPRVTITKEECISLWKPWRRALIKDTCQTLRNWIKPIPAPTSGFILSGATLKRETSGFKASHVNHQRQLIILVKTRRRIIHNRI